MTCWAASCARYELDPAGKSVGFYDPYVGGIPDPDPGFFEPGQSFTSLVNGNFTNYTVDGISVPKDYFRTMVEFAYGGVFGLVEHQAKLSAMPPILQSLQVGNKIFPANLQGANQAITEAIESDTWSITRNWAVTDSWAVNWSLIPDFEDAVADDDERVPDSTLNLLHENLEKLKENKRCASFLKALVNNIPDEVTVNGTKYKKFSGSLIENFDRIRKTGGFWLREMQDQGQYVDDTIWFGKKTFMAGDNTKEFSGLSYVFKSPPFRITKNFATTVTLIHELIHAYYPSNKFGNMAVDHEQMAVAAQQALQQSGISKDLIPRAGMSATAYFRQAVTYACGKEGQ